MRVSIEMKAVNVQDLASLLRKLSYEVTKQGKKLPDGMYDDFPGGHIIQYERRDPPGSCKVTDWYELRIEIPEG